MKKYLWTSLKTRLQFIKSTPGSNFNWLFLPGGPGLGSESLSSLTNKLKLPGTMWHVDLPGDGSNTTSHDKKYFSNWSLALLECVSTLKKCSTCSAFNRRNVCLVSAKTRKAYCGFGFNGFSA